MKKIFVLFVVAMFFAACPASEVTKVGNPNLDETQDVTQITNPPGPLTETEGVTQIGNPNTTPSGGEGLGGGEAGEIKAVQDTKANLGPLSNWASLGFSAMIDGSNWTAFIDSSVQGCVISKGVFPIKFNDDGSIETQPDPNTGCKIKGKPDEEGGGLMLVGSDEKTVVTLNKVTMASPEMMKNAKDASPAKKFIDPKFKDLIPKTPSNEKTDSDKQFQETPNVDQKSKVLVQPK